ncbi:MAG: 2-dehydropantoate 2-reductase [Rhodospirillaceae bacterium]|nr:2-dehydropantoate 2-reductase [Rhodospirillaceae bacterium]
MKICIYGAGAIGGYLGVQLALSGVEVSLIARGRHLEAMRSDGLRLRIDGETRTARPFCTDDPAELGPQDFVIMALKAQSLTAVAELVPTLFNKDTAVVTAQNGIPWWYFHGLAGPWEGRRVESVDPGGCLWDNIGPERVVGCVAYASLEVSEPGVITHAAGNRFLLGEPDGATSQRTRRLSEALEGAGFASPVLDDIRSAIWEKLWGNAPLNPVSALTLATADVMVDDDHIRPVLVAIMTEVRAVAQQFGVTFDAEIETRIERAGIIGAHKTSMLQDLEAGRPMEIEALGGAIVELGRLVDVATPSLDTVLGLLRLRQRTALTPGGATKPSH